MEYRNLTGRDVDALRAERITVLEGEHFRLALRREEVIEAAEFEAISSQMTELERRIALHRAQDSPTPVEPQRADVES